jgi:hypothetical protein
MIKLAKSKVTGCLIFLLYQTEEQNPRCFKHNKESDHPNIRITYLIVTCQNYDYEIDSVRIKVRIQGGSHTIRVYLAGLICK